MAINTTSRPSLPKQFTRSAIFMLTMGSFPMLSHGQAVDPGRPGHLDHAGITSPVMITVKAFPNPFDSWINVQVADCMGKAIRIELATFPNGQVVLQQALVYSGPVLLNTTQVPFGNHILSVRDMQGNLLGSREVQRQAGP